MTAKETALLVEGCVRAMHESDLAAVGEYMSAARSQDHAQPLALLTVLLQMLDLSVEWAAASSGRTHAEVLAAIRAALTRQSTA